MRQPAGEKHPSPIIILLMTACSHTCRSPPRAPTQVAQLAASARKTHAGTSATCGMAGGPTDYLAGEWALKGRHRQAQAGMHR